MNTFKRSRDFSVRPSTGSLRPAEPRFSTGFRVTVAGVEVEVSDEEVVAAALRIVASRLLHSSPLMSPRHSREYVSLRFSGLEYEVFSCLYLDNRHRVIAFEELFRGTIDGSLWLTPSGKIPTAAPSASAACTARKASSLRLICVGSSVRR